MSEQNGLPASWSKAPLKDITSPGGTRNPQSGSGGDFLYVDIEALDNVAHRIVAPKRIARDEAPSRARMAIQAGDVVFSLVRPYLENIAVVPDELDGEIASTAYCVLRPMPGVVSSYVFHALTRQSFINAVTTYGNSPPSARDDEFVLMEIPVAPTNEQHRIVAAIEQQFTRLDAGVAALRRVRAALKRYRAAVLKAAVEGRLTEAWRAAHPDAEPGSALLARILAERRARWEADLRAKGKDPAKMRYAAPAVPDTASLPVLPKGWCWAGTEQIAASDEYSMAIGPFGSNLKVEDYREEGIPLVFVRNIRSGIFDGPDTHYITASKAEELRPHRVSAGDILITKMGDPPGDACIYPQGHPAAIITADCIKWALSPLLPDARYFMYAINSLPVRTQIIGITKGVAQLKVSLARFKGIAAPLPPVAEQQEIVAEVERRLSVVSEVEAAIEANLTRAERLRQSILERAFSGRLVPQDPSDEPASALLERIRREREAATNTRAKNGVSADQPAAVAASQKPLWE